MSRSTLSVRAPATASPHATNGSQTTLQTELRGQPSDASATLRLRAEPAEQSHVRWADDVVDNEGMGKKSSKVCCIYHKPHEPGDSDSESDSSSDSDSEDSEPDLSRAQAAGGNNRRRRRGHGHDQRKPASNKNHGRTPSPNAYEKQPKPQSKG